MSVFALFAVAAFGVAYIGPLSASTTQAEAAELDPLSLYAGTIADAQSYLARSDQSVSLGRDGMVYTVYVAPKPTPTPTPTAVEESSTASAPARSSPRPSMSQGPRCPRPPRFPPCATVPRWC